MVTLDGISVKARDFVDGLDRSVLGSFAISRDALIAVVTVRLAMDVYGMARSFSEVDSRDINRLADDLSFLEWAECHLWMGWIASSFETSTRYGLLTKVRDAPKGFLDFYERGFWDDEAIAEFVAGGVDVEMALRVMADGAQ